MNSKTILLLVISTCLILNLVSADKILVLSFFSSKSHKLTYMPLVEELGKRGHQITLVSPIKATKELKNVKEVFTYDMQKDLDQQNMFEMKESNTQMNPAQMIKMVGGVCRKSHDLPQVMDLLNQSFDLIILQGLFNDCALGIVYKLKAPFVLFMPGTVSSMTVSRVGGDFPPSFVPNVLLGYSDEMTFYQRIMNFGVSVFLEGVLKFYFEPKMTQVYRDKLGEDLPSVNEILGNTSLVLSNGHFSLSQPKPYLPDIVDVGGIHSRPAKPIPKDLGDFVSKSGKDGFIYFSMGSAIKGDQMKETKRKMFINVFSKLKQQVLWKWESETMPDLPKNVKLSKWLPQQDLLGHPNIKMFITHCGGGSTEEAIYHGVPLLGIPMFADQPANAREMKKHGFLVDLEWNELTEETLTNAINEILDNPKYRNNVQKLSKIFKDQPNDPLERGAFWVEYVMRHKGAPHLRSAARKLNYFQYHSWDVIAAYALIIFVIFKIIFVILKLIVRKLCGFSRNDSKNSISRGKKNK